MRDQSSGDVIVYSAFACHPGMSSEAGIGWQFLRLMAPLANAANSGVVAYMNGRSAVATRARLSDLGLDDIVEVRPVDVPPLLRWLQHPKLTRAEYIVWSLIVRRRARDLAARRAPLAAFHVTFASEILPHPFQGLSERTFKVWGPVGSSGVPGIFKLWPREPGWVRDYFLQALRNRVSTHLFLNLARSVDLVLLQSERHGLADDPEGPEMQIFPNVIVPSELMDAAQPSLDGTPTSLNLLAAGHLTSRKRYSLAIAALTEPSLREARLQIAGAPLPGTRSYLEKVALRLGVAERVHFLGKLDRSKLLQLMRSSDVLLHLSAREGASGTVGEATAVGIPVVCFDGTGASSVLRESGSSGVILDVSSFSLPRMAAAVLVAASCTRVSFDGWTEERIALKIAELIELAKRRRRS